jgi:4-hydroxybenzoate polyprenyltransferase
MVEIANLLTCALAFLGPAALTIWVLLTAKRKGTSFFVLLVLYSLYFCIAHNVSIESTDVSVVAASRFLYFGSIVGVLVFGCLGVILMIVGLLRKRRDH